MALNKDRLSDYIDKETEAISGQPGGTDDIQEESVNKYEKLDMEMLNEVFNFDDPLPDLTIADYKKLSWEEKFFYNRKAFLLEYAQDLKAGDEYKRDVGCVLMQNNINEMLYKKYKLGDSVSLEGVTYIVTSVSTTKDPQVTEGYIKITGKNENGTLSESHVFLVCEMEITNSTDVDIPSYAFNRMRFDFFVETENWWNETIEYCSFQPGAGTSLYYYNYFPAGETVECYFAADVPIEAINQFDAYLLINNSHSSNLDASKDGYIYLSDIEIVE